MRIHSRQLVAATAVLVLLAAPVHAQDTSSTVTFNGIGFTFDAILGSSVDITTVPAGPQDQQIPGGPDVRHVTYTLYGPKAEFARTPRVGNADTTVRVYRVSDLVGNTFAAQQATDLAALLAARPDLAATEVVNGQNGVDPLPFLPAIPAAEAVHARGAYVDMPGLSGITYVTAFRQDVSPFLRNDFQYTFQGLTTDGQWYISVEAIVDTTLFPKKLGPKVFNGIAKRWPAYLTKSIAKLDGAQPADFTPSLDTVDALIASITVEGVPASEPGPAASTAPAASVAPAASPVASASPAA